MINLVGLAAFPDQDAAADIRRVVNAYRELGRTFGWVVGPTSKPKGLRDHLLAAGLVEVPEEAMWGMAVRDLGTPIPANPAIRVEEVAPTDLRSHEATVACSYGFGMTDDVADVAIGFYELLGATVYLAFVPAQEAPVAWSGAVFDPDGEVVVLLGASTLAEHRGRGIYTSMVSARLAKARSAAIGLPSSRRCEQPWRRLRPGSGSRPSARSRCSSGRRHSDRSRRARGRENAQGRPCGRRAFPSEAKTWSRACPPSRRASLEAMNGQLT